MRTLYKRLGIEGGLTTAYHPAANGQVERTNAEVAQHLRLFVNKQQNNWAEYLPTAEFVINSRMNLATKSTPFELLYGYLPDFTVPVGRPSNIPAAEQRLSRLREARKDAEAAMRMAKEKMQRDGAIPDIKVGDWVWLSAKNIAIHQQSNKLGPKRLGPYEVLEKRSDRNYRLWLPPHLKLHDIFHVSRLMPWRGNEINGEVPPEPQPVLVDGEEEYEVESVLDSRLSARGGLSYLVRWKGYGAGGDSWEPARNVKNAQEAVDAFHRAQPDAPRRLSASLFASLPWQVIQAPLTVTKPPLDWEDGRRKGLAPFEGEGH